MWDAIGWDSYFVDDAIIQVNDRVSRTDFRHGVSLMSWWRAGIPITSGIA